jgi:malonyl-CoA O-methyltransferase
VSIRLEDALPEKGAARRAFEKARNFDSACFVHDEARARLLARLPLLRLDPRIVVDLGCATGRGASALASHYGNAHVLAVDSSMAMLRSAAASAARSIAVLGGDAEALPLRAGSVDLVLASLVLPWCRPDRLFAEAARVLATGGAFLFATLGPDSLQQVRTAFASVDDRIHVHAAFDMHDLGDLATAAGLAEPVLDVDKLEVTYADVASLVRDLRAVGGVNVALGRRRALTGRRRWGRFVERLPRGADGRFAVTVELILGQAWGAAPRPSQAEIRIPIERIRRS